MSYLKEFDEICRRIWLFQALETSTSEVAKFGQISNRRLQYALYIKFAASLLSPAVIWGKKRVAKETNGDRQLSPSLVRNLMAKAEMMIEESVDRMKTFAGDTDLIAVGGGAFLIPDKIKGVGKVHRVEHAGVANALGAAMAQISGEVDQIFSNLSRDVALSEAEAMAVSRCVEAGAAVDTVKTIEVEDLPLSYLKGNSRRIRVRVVGDIRTRAH